MKHFRVLIASCLLLVLGMSMAFRGNFIPQSTAHALAMSHAAIPACPDVGAAESYLMDGATRKVLCERDSDTVMAIASTTKMMTALIAIESGRIGRTVIITKAMVNYLSNRYGVAPDKRGSYANLQEGDQLTLEQLLYGLLLPSGNDAAIAIAIEVGQGQTNETADQSVTHFVQKMNTKAKQLGLSDTHFANPLGRTEPTSGNHIDWNKSNKSTASDLTYLAQTAMQYPLFATIVATRDYNLADTTRAQGEALRHHQYRWGTNNLFLRIYGGAIGIKDGYNSYAGASLAFSAIREKDCRTRTLIGVILLGRGKVNAVMIYPGAEKLLDWGFSQAQETPNI